MLTIHAVPELRSPVLLCGFTGWADAASAASSALRYLLLKRKHQRIAEFDPDAIFVYTTTRPLNLFDGQGRRRLQWPALTWEAMQAPESPRDLVVLLGPEPDLRWHECIRLIGDFAQQIGVSQLLTFGAFMGQVHYTGTPTLQGASNDPLLQTRMQALGIRQSSYQGPTSFSTALLRDASDRGMLSASLWAAAPNYLPNSSNPKLAAALLRAAEQILGQGLWVDELEAAGRDMERRIKEALRERPDLATFLRQLSGGAKPSEEPSAAAVEEQEQELPSAEEVLRDLEEHLRRLKGNKSDEDD